MDHVCVMHRVAAPIRLQLCINVWRQQVEVDTAGIRKLYSLYDDDGNGVLSFEVCLNSRWRVEFGSPNHSAYFRRAQEFSNLVRACAPSMGDILTDIRLTQMFDEVRGAVAAAP